MITYNNDQIQENEMETDFEDLGSVDITRLDGSIPFYSYNYANHDLKNYDEEICNGSCEDFLHRYINHYFVEVSMEQQGEDSVILKSPVKCQLEDIGPTLFDSGIMYFCPPKHNISMDGDLMSYPHKVMQYMIMPVASLMEAETSKMIGKINLHRYQMVPIVDYSIHNEDPVHYIPKLLNKYKLSTKL